MYRTFSALVGALALTGLPAAAHAQDDLVITNVRVFTGQERMERASIAIAGGKIAQISSGAPLSGRTVIDGAGMTALPGLIDVHAHIFAATAGVTEAETLAFVKSRLPGRLRAMLEHGVTTVKSNGDPTDIILQVRRDLRDGRLTGPRLLAVGSIFTATGGHPAMSFVCGGDPWCRATTAAEVDTPDAARRAVARLAASGVDGIKIVFAGGVRNGVEMKKLTPAAMRAIVDEARARGLRVTAHVTDEPSALEVLAAGVWGMEHGPTEAPMTAALVEALRSGGRSFIPTLYGAVDNPALLQIKSATVAAAHKAGVRVVAGSDISGTKPPGQAMLDEVQLLVKAGLTPEAALRSATALAALHIGKEKEIGTLSPGMSADILLVRGNPLTNIADITQTDRVIQRGTVVHAAARDTR